VNARSMRQSEWSLTTRSTGPATASAVSRLARTLGRTEPQSCGTHTAMRSQLQPNSCSQASMNTQILTLQVPSGTSLYLWFEPWAEGWALPAGSIVELHATSPIDGALEVDTTPERTAIYGWPGSTLRALVRGEQVLSFEQPVPEFLTKDKVELLFGSPPNPTATEKANGRRRPWWRFWQ
jgi:hypothetical protein